jgi:hypothetical protein
MLQQFLPSVPVLPGPPLGYSSHNTPGQEGETRLTCPHIRGDDNRLPMDISGPDI